MTDERLPGRQRAAKWRSGNPTIAPSGADFVTGPGWGHLSDTLAVAVLKGERLLFVKFNRKGRLRWTTAPAELLRPELPVCYVVERHGLSNALILEQACRDAGLPSPLLPMAGADLPGAGHPARGAGSRPS